jgi:hypothetical protein
MRNNNHFSVALSLVDPNNIIPCLEQSIEVEEIKLSINPCREIEAKIRDLNFILTVLQAQAPEPEP